MYLFLSSIFPCVNMKLFIDKEHSCCTSRQYLAQAGEANDPICGPNSVMNPSHVPSEALCAYAQEYLTFIPHNIHWLECRFEGAVTYFLEIYKLFRWITTFGIRIRHMENYNCIVCNSLLKIYLLKCGNSSEQGMTSFWSKQNPACHLSNDSDVRDNSMKVK